MPLAEAYVAGMGHIHWVDFDSHGYNLIEVTPERVVAEWWAVDTVLRRTTVERRVATWSVEHGVPRARRGCRPLDFAAMPTFKTPRGTRDLLPPETATWTRLERLAADLAARYGYRRIETPLFELTDVFERGVGEVTDIVEKELFRLAPRTEESEAWALRPEPTAGIVRAYVQHGMQTWPQPVKLTETGPMFRYDRPQAGRYRQFWQFDIEAIGDPGPAIDAEIIELGVALLPRRRTRRASRSTSIRSATRPAGPAYIAELTAYFDGHRDALPPLERDRLGRNVLRLLDSKDPAMAALNAAAPEDHRPPVRCVRRALRRASGRISMRSACRTGSSPASSAASTTTPGPRSSSTSPAARASSRRSAAAAATTGWSSCSAGGRRPASGSGSASIG